MNNYLTSEYWRDLYHNTLSWSQTYLLTTAALSQLGAIIGCLLLARALAPGMRSRLQKWQPGNSMTGYFSPLVQRMATLSVAILFVLFNWIVLLIADAAGWENYILRIASSLFLAWVIIQTAAGIVRNSFWAKFISVFAWTIAALYIVGLLQPTIEVLDAAAITIGAIRLSALGIIKAILTLVVLLWLALLFSDLFERQISTSKDITPSIQVLLSKIIKIIAITAALLLALSGIGIDLTAFAVFSGAIGVGIGFGLQKIFSNLISGVILLLDKSIKPGDVIGVDNYYGQVESLGARYVSVITRDGIEYLIPNEDIITQQVENWSHTQQLLRLKIPVGVHYQCDVDKAIALCLEAAGETERVLKDPGTVCLLKGFGDSSVDLEIRFWINDPMNGRANVISQILLKVWHKFHAHDIEIPYPQRDIHVRTVDTELAQFKTITNKDT